MLRTWVRAWLAAAVLGAPGAVAWGQTASGGDVDLQAFRPALDSRGLVTVEASQVLGPGDISFGLVTSWGYRVLELEGATRAHTVTHLITPQLQAAFGAFRGVEVGATLPFHVISGDPVTAQGVGDVGLHAKARILDTSRYPVGLAVVGSVYFPGPHAEGAWLGEDQAVFEPTLIVDAEPAGIRISANVGYRSREPRTFMDEDMTLRSGAEVPFGAGVALPLVRRTFDVVVELFGSVPLHSVNYAPLEALVGTKLYLARSSYFTLGAGAGLLDGPAGGNPDVRGFVGMVFEPAIGDRDRDGLKDDVDRCPDEPEDYDDFEDMDGCPEPDNDRDEIPDALDRCPNEPEDKDGVEDHDGCPEPDELDRDGDSILDVEDACPDEPEDKDGVEDTDGCPDHDNDDDRILDVDDLCPDDPEDKDGVEDTDGCPDLDNDRDRIPDTLDRCKNEPESYNGVDDDDGCPDRDITRETDGEIILLEKIYFETDSARIRPESHRVLDAVAFTLAHNPMIRIVEIQGHADERGSDEYNLRLTQARAESVRDYLIGKDIEPRRLRARGYGERAPLDRRSTPEAWSKNRRVQFMILAREGE